ncbi:LysR substrate-binding domain-containing protein [Falsihalocynthiibacter sp. BN13B15]|uniref:LysR substrate-binding domain-containing protein n=1 Tax=Falsihalocynthiibacter sp. BN13B15 TaxID=3240871 RepID=UPI00351040D9
MRNINLNTLQMFDAAARHQNFRLAAEELNLTQGAVAQRIRQLETDLGQPLFERLPRGLKLTKQGQTYHRSIHQALAIITKATAVFKPDGRRITLSVPPSFATKWLVPRLPDFERAHPEIELQIRAEEGLADFKNDGIDLAIRQGAPPFAENLDWALFAPLNLVAIGHHDLPITSVSDFARYTLIQDSHKHWDALINAEEIVPERRFLQFNQTALAMDAAQNGQGIALIPHIFFNLTDKAQQVLWSLPASDNVGFYLVWPKDAAQKTASVAVRDWLLGALPPR